MDLALTIAQTEGYKSNSQIARIITENWVSKNSYCPNCGNNHLNTFDNNQPVADFFCKSCNEEYELKSKAGKIANKIVDGAYSTMIERITSTTNPNFFFLSYDLKKLIITNFLIIPKHFFVPEIINRRSPLSQTARRAGWIGCNINISNVPTLGRIFLVSNSKVINKREVLSKWESSIFLRRNTIESKGWTLDVLNCLDRISKYHFSINDVYAFEKQLSQKHPDNSFIKDKIRQQLQILRDKGIIEFVGRGQYKKIKK